MDKELNDILDCLMKYTSDGDSQQDAKYLEVIQTDLVMYFKRLKKLPKEVANNLLVKLKRDYEMEGE